MAERSLTINKSYLNLPLLYQRSRDEGDELGFYEGETLIRWTKVSFPAENESADWIYSMDVSALLGKRVRLRHPAVSVEALNAVYLSDMPEERDPEDLWDEELRPQFHFSPRRGWINDPNGMHYADGRYHLFMQFNPVCAGASAGNNMHWGHAVSADMLTWTEREPAIYPDFGGQIYSGTGFLDLPDTLGLKHDTAPTRVLYYTEIGKRGANQSFVVSRDGGETWQRITDAPSLPQIHDANRDPCVFRYSPGNHWVMLLHNGIRGPETAYWIFTSDDLRTWKKTDEIPGFYECPEMFELPVNGDPADTRWVVHGGHSMTMPSGEWGATRASCLVGTFNGRKFTPESEVLPGHAGPHFYAAQCFSNMPDGRVVMMGWAAGAEFPAMRFNGCLSFPLELSLLRVDGEYYLRYQPVTEIKSLVQEEACLEFADADYANLFLSENRSELMDIEMVVENPEEAFSFCIRGEQIHWHPESSSLICRGIARRILPSKKGLRLRTLVDRNFLEVFGEDGKAAYACTPDVSHDEILIFGDAQIASLTVRRLHPIHS